MLSPRHLVAHVDVERMVLLQYPAQLRRDPLGKMTRHPTADPDDLEMRNGSQTLAQLVDAPVGKEQRIPARHDYVADLDVLLEVAERRLELGHGDLLGVAHFPAAGAETAIRGAYRRHEEQRAVGIAVGDVRHRRVGILGQRVPEAFVYFELLQVWHVLPDLQELEVHDGLVDSLAEDANSPEPNITHRYPDRALFLVSPVCAAYCRFC